MTESDFSLIRPMTDDDLEKVVDLMVTSFPRRDVSYFRAGLQRLGAREVPPGAQKYGYVIDDGGMKGAVLSISSIHRLGTLEQTIHNISTWCVAPSHRGPLAKALYDRAAGPETALMVNLSAAKHTLKTLDKLGFRPVTNGQFIALAYRGDRRSSARMLSLDEAVAAGLAEGEERTLRDQRTAGCLVACLELPDGLMPLVFLRRRFKRVLTGGQLILCEDLARFVANAAPVLTWLRKQGQMALIMDANGPMPEFRGTYMDGKAAKYIRGAAPIRDIDYTYSEMYYLGF